MTIVVPIFFCLKRQKTKFFLKPVYLYEKSKIKNGKKRKSY